MFVWRPSLLLSVLPFYGGPDREPQGSPLLRNMSVRQPAWATATLYRVAAVFQATGRHMQNNSFSFIKPPRLAVLIDAENISATHAAHLMELVTQQGNPTIRRAYADWTNQHSASWRKVLEKLVIRPVQQFHYSKGKNATDSALIMDALELLHETNRRVDGFCIVSSDSDYTGLAIYGYGQHGAAPSFVAACNAFVFLTSGVGRDADAFPTYGHLWT